LGKFGEIAENYFEADSDSLFCVGSESTAASAIAGIGNPGG